MGPTNPKTLKQIYLAAQCGWTEERISRFVGVEPPTFSGWKSNYPAVAEAIQSGRDSTTLYVKALSKTAEGFSYIETTEEWAPPREEVDYLPNPDDPARPISVIKKIPKKLVSVKKTKKYVVPNVAAIKYALNNRDREHWKESSSLDVTTNGKDLTRGMDLALLSDEEIETLARLEEKATVKPPDDAERHD